MLDKDNKKKTTTKSILNDPNFINIKFDPLTTPKVEEPLANSSGLDFSNPDYIKFKKGNLEAEVIGGVNMLVVGKLQVLLKIAKRPQQNSSDVYRNNVNLYDSHNTDYFVKNAVSTLKIDSSTLKDFIYDLTERLENYRKDRMNPTQSEFETVTPQPKQAKEIKNLLKQENLLEEVQELMKQSGAPCSKIATQLFVMSLSSKGTAMMHTIIQGSPILSNAILKSFEMTMPEETGTYKTSISDSVLYYTPSRDYWKNKVLVLASLDTMKKKNNALKELVTQGVVNRMVTESNDRGVYRAETKNVNGKFCLISATAEEFHELSNSSNVLTLPIQDPKKINENMVTQEIKHHAGMMDRELEEQARFKLQTIYRNLSHVKVVNPYLDQLDLEKYFDKDYNRISLFLRITNLITLLHQKQLGGKNAKGVFQVEVKPEHMTMTLELFREIWVKEEQELNFSIAKTLELIKAQLEKENKGDCKDEEFTERDMRAMLKAVPTTFNRHINMLYDYARIDRTGGNRRDGFNYKVTSWGDSDSPTKLYLKLTEAINSL